MTANFNIINASEQIVLGSITAPLLASNAAVLSVHSDGNPTLTGSVQLVSGSHVSLSQVGQAITINATGELSQALTDNHIFVGNASNMATDVPMSGDATIVASGALTLSTVNSNVGSFTNANITVNSKGLITSVSNGTSCLPLSGGTLTGALGIGESPVPSAALDVASTTQGFLPPRMTTAQMNAISSPAEGLEVYVTDTHQWMGWDGSSWVILG